MDVGGWLRNIGVGQYEGAFLDNEIDGEVLPHLTADDLETLGVVSVGHRRKLLTAIKHLLAAATPVAPPAEVSRASASAERRPITVMFCDLVGSTSLAARLDPEDWRNLVGSYLDAASAAVTSLGAHVLTTLGDGLMVLFGYPHAEENDGERAVRAALAIQRALADLNARNAGSGTTEITARIKLDSGRVVVDHTGEVYGEVPNVAARVQSAAAPGELDHAGRSPADRRPVRRRDKGEPALEQGTVTPPPGTFIRIGPDGAVTLYAPYVEMGQGAYTVQVQILAEELGADTSRSRRRRPARFT